MAVTTGLRLVCFGLWITFAAGCEDGTPPARSAENAEQPETWAAPRTPPHPRPKPIAPEPIELAEEPEQPAPAPAPKPEPEPAAEPRKIVGWIIRDKDGKEVARVPTWEAGLPQRREQIQRALEPLVRDAVEPYEKVAAKRAFDMALAAAETKSAKDAVQAALDMYQADVDRAVRLKTRK